ncbi:hypothetical protein [Williamsia sp. 1135]|uniref:hypothetical protein n=1 Tax=Williamsia sp. 1135 TaxID=1889262 RepID=UPI000A11232A|nr:hypothetical protein [Williamsia sp. 1135]ORM30100.1 hypothetical protein BFL43_18715 [Williamsia sp. 1135]
MPEGRTGANPDRWYGPESVYAAAAMFVASVSSVLIVPGLVILAGFLALISGLVMVPLGGRQRRIATGLLAGLLIIPLTVLMWYPAEVIRGFVT